MSDTRKRPAELDTSTAFRNFEIDSSDFLATIPGRSKCPQCKRSRKFFCYTCYIPMESVANRIPKVKLPLKVSVVKHPQEIDGKSTAVHAAVLAPGCVSISPYPNLPNLHNSLLVFPSDDAEDAQTYFQHLKSENQKFSFDQVIFIDSTWNQTYKISHDPRLIGLPKVKLSGIQSLFWRYHTGNPSTHLATIEAMYYFFRAYHSVFGSELYSGQYDNLLFFFRYMFDKIRTLYDPTKMRAYTKRPYVPDLDVGDNGLQPI